MLLHYILIRIFFMKAKVSSLLRLKDAPFQFLVVDVVGSVLVVVLLIAALLLLLFAGP